MDRERRLCRRERSLLRRLRDRERERDLDSDADREPVADLDGSTSVLFKSVSASVCS